MQVEIEILVPDRGQGAATEERVREDVRAALRRAGIDCQGVTLQRWTRSGALVVVYDIPLDTWELARVLEDQGVDVVV